MGCLAAVAMHSATMAVSSAFASTTTSAYSRKAHPLPGPDVGVQRECEASMEGCDELGEAISNAAECGRCSASFRRVPLVALPILRSCANGTLTPIEAEQGASTSETVTYR